MRSRTYGAGTRREFLKAAAGAGAAAMFLPLADVLAAAQERKLNVLFIMSDQHNARALGCYGSTEVRTPHLDGLARDGVLFERAFCQTPQCCPSRYTIWTGRYARTHGLYFNGMMEDSREVTVGHLFKQAGYVTATIGKNHMHMAAGNGNHGFDVVIDRHDKEFARRGQFLPYDKVHPGNANVGESALGNERHETGLHTAAAIEFLDKHRRQPFCLWLSYYGPHTPICPSRPWARMYDPDKLALPPNNQYDFDPAQPGLAALKKKWADGFTPALHRRVLGYYYGLVSQIDFNIGRVLKKLDDLGLAKDTIVVYTADHGEMMSEHGAWTKGQTGYDATVRVPMIVRLPGVLPAGARRTELVGAIDLLPTLLDLAGRPIPANVQGHSLMGLFGKPATPWRTAIFSELGQSTQDTVIAVRTATHKYVLYRKAGRVQYEQLFDLQADPWEMKNLAAGAEHRAVLETLRKSLAEWESATPAAAPSPRPARAGRAQT